jgi:hypothetical protein
MQEYLSQELAMYKPIEIMYLKNGKVSPLQRWLDGVIDLDKIFRIDNVRGYDSEMFYYSTEKNYVEFYMTTNNNAGKISYRWRLHSRNVNITKEEFDKHPRFPNSHYGDSYVRSEYNMEWDAKRCQETIVDDLIKVWRMYREE